MVVAPSESVAVTRMTPVRICTEPVAVCAVSVAVAVPPNVMPVPPETVVQA